VTVHGQRVPVTNILIGAIPMCFHLNILRIHVSSVKTQLIYGHYKCGDMFRLIELSSGQWFNNWPDDDSMSRNMSPHL